MDSGNSPFCSGAKIVSITSAVAEINTSKGLDYVILVFFLWAEKSREWRTNGEHTEFITPLVNISQSNEWIGFCLEWINEFSIDQILNRHNFTTTKAISKQKILA